MNKKVSFKGIAVLLLALGLTTFPILAAENTMPPDEAETFLQETSSRCAAIETLQASFTQVRSTRLLKKSAVTKGNFYYRKPSSFLWQFTDPYTLSVLSNGKFLFKTDRKRGTYSKLKVKKYEYIV